MYVQVERVGTSDRDEVEYKALERAEDEKLSLKLNTNGPKIKAEAVLGNPSVFKVPEARFSSSSSVRSFSSTASSKERKKSALEELREEQERFKEKKFHKDYWLMEVKT